MDGRRGRFDLTKTLRVVFEKGYDMSETVQNRQQSVVDPQTGKTTTFQVFSIKDKVRKKRPQTSATTPDSTNKDKK